MTQQQKERITVTAIVEKKGQGKSGNEASVTIGAFESKYPTLLNKIPDADFALLVPGQTVTIIIERGNPMKPKEGGSYDGSKPWMFWWNWVGMTTPGAAPAVTPKPASAPAPAERPIAREDPTRRSIERQTALIQAVAFAGHCMNHPVADKEVSAAWVLVLAQAFLGFLQAEANSEPKLAMPEGRELTPGVGDPTAPPWTWTRFWEQVKAWGLNEADIRTAIKGLSIEQAVAELMKRKPAEEAKP